jgi:hypothetical protein
MGTTTRHVFLALPEASHVTGTVYAMAGGVSLP